MNSSTALSFCLRNSSIFSFCSLVSTLLTSGFLPGPDGLRPALVRQPFMRHEKRLLVAEVLIHHLDTLRMEAPDRIAGFRTDRISNGEHGHHCRPLDHRDRCLPSGGCPFDGRLEDWSCRS